MFIQIIDVPIRIVLNESWLGDEYFNYNLDGYKFKQINRNRYNGGIAFHYQENCELRAVKELTNVCNDYEILMLKAAMCNYECVWLVNVYRPPTGNATNFSIIQAVT